MNNGKSKKILNQNKINQNKIPSNFENKNKKQT